jgi:hypothetical protein
MKKNNMKPHMFKTFRISGNKFYFSSHNQITFDTSLKSEQNLLL